MMAEVEIHPIIPLLGFHLFHLMPVVIRGIIYKDLYWPEMIRDLPNCRP
jgi:hypothetical protein